jgi:3-oxoacyl-[acyl-carrier protein] reductase
MDIAGKNVVITGGGRGMGKQFAVDLKALGAKPYVVDVVQENLDALKNETGINGEILDVTNEQAVVDFFERYTSENGAPHVLINNAGITGDALFIKAKDGAITKFPVDKWDRVINVNLKGVFLCAREAAAQMIKHNVPGVIINISSISRAGNRGQTNYSATKAGVDAMTVTWAKELSRNNIRAAAIAPGYINTEMVAAIDPKAMEPIIKQILVNRLGDMKEISLAVKFIIECDFYNGRTLEVDGGHRI